MKSHFPLSSRLSAFTRRRFLTTLAPLGLGTALLGMPLHTAFAASRMQRQKSNRLLVTELSAPVLAPSQDGRLELFTIDDDSNTMYHRWQFSDLSWSDWYSHGTGSAGGFFFSSEAPYMKLVKMSDGTLILLAWDFIDAKLYSMRQVAPSSGWSGWQYLAPNPGARFAAEYQMSSPPVAAVDGTGNLQLFISAPYSQTASTLYQGTLTPGGSWSGWTQLSPPSGESLVWPATAANPDGRLELFALGSVLWHTWQTSVGGSWAPWYSHGTPGVSPDGYPVLFTPIDAPMELYVLGGDSVLYQLPQVVVNANWGSWQSFGTPVGAQFGELAETIAVGSSADGRREVFAVANDGNLWHRWQTDFNGNWSSWYSHGSPAGSPRLAGGVAIALNTDDRLELFANTINGDLYSIRQAVRNGGWSSWIDFGRP